MQYDRDFETAKLKLRADIYQIASVAHLRSEPHEPLIEALVEQEIEVRDRLAALIRLLERSGETEIGADELERMYLQPARLALGQK